ncbi:hypothetical protein FB382_003077 [Nocardioides ginsengisegetis]|uniref:Restriction endonuclease type IV Mrr domain-containing protein n=1 Tax=Nocardioides ginsengisegetis TaxID=661491 RepID=A0A7W3J1Y1_9ACTN|nr:restriction endonuclease [Nocardioides ginsengisegetis]MBA8804786.1 hypothetical protein [Nocardioides ginsengisegetis]
MSGSETDVKQRLASILGQYDPRWISPICAELGRIGKGTRLEDAFVIEGYVWESDRGELLVCLLGDVMYTVCTKGASARILALHPSAFGQSRPGCAVVLRYATGTGGTLEARGRLRTRPGESAPETTQAYNDACRHEKGLARLATRARAEQKAARRAAEDESRRLLEAGKVAVRDELRVLNRRVPGAKSLDARISLMSDAVDASERVDLAKTIRQFLRRAREVDPGLPVAFIPGMVRVSTVGQEDSTKSAVTFGPVLITDNHLLWFPAGATRTYSLAGADATFKRYAGRPFNSVEVALNTHDGQFAVTAHCRNETWTNAARLEAGLRYALGRKTTPSSPSAAPLICRPELRLIRTAHEAEQVVAEWLTYLGFGSASLTKSGPDGGIDVQTSTVVAQVKMEAVPSGRPALQQLLGAAVIEAKTPVFFSLAGYTREAVEWADRASMALFQFDFQGEPTPVNESARSAVAAAVGRDTT